MLGKEFFYLSSSYIYNSVSLFFFILVPPSPWGRARVGSLANSEATSFSIPKQN